MAKHRTCSAEFKCPVVQEYLRGETLHGLSKRHDIARNPIRIWIGKVNAGALDEEVVAADLLQTHQARIAALVEAMSRICEQFERYGWRRVRAALRQQGMLVNHKKVRRLMREHDLQPRMRRRHLTTTDRDHDQPIFSNLARR